MFATLIDISDCELYGILEVKDRSKKEVQDKIDEIKIRFNNEGFDFWTLEDVFNAFPDEWEWEYTEQCAFDSLWI